MLCHMGNQTIKKPEICCISIKKQELNLWFFSIACRYSWGAVCRESALTGQNFRSVHCPAPLKQPIQENKCFWAPYLVPELLHLLLLAPSLQEQVLGCFSRSWWPLEKRQSSALQEMKGREESLKH